MLHVPPRYWNEALARTASQIIDFAVCCVSPLTLLPCEGTGVYMRAFVGRSFSRFRCNKNPVLSPGASLRTSLLESLPLHARFSSLAAPLGCSDGAVRGPFRKPKSPGYDSIRDLQPSYRQRREVQQQQLFGRRRIPYSLSQQLCRTHEKHVNRKSTTLFLLGGQRADPRDYFHRISAHSPPPLLLPAPRRILVCWIACPALPHIPLLHVPPFRCISPSSPAYASLSRSSVVAMVAPAFPKKSLAEPVASSYQPAAVEADWAAWWEKNSFFTPTNLMLFQRQLLGSEEVRDRRSSLAGSNNRAAGACAENGSTETSTAAPSPPQGDEESAAAAAAADLAAASLACLQKTSCELAMQTRPGRKFVMVIPPPNVTGSLHIGHTLTVAIQDALARWHRMNGKVVLWVPGTDHAGIATQSVVERALLKKGVTRHELGRDKFVQEVWKWKEEFGNTICHQLRRVASSVSWPHFSFTLDERLSRAVVEAFVRLYDRGLIFRAERLVTWSPYLKTAISDIEVDVEEIDKPTKISIPGFRYPVDVGYLWHFWYEVEGGKDRLPVATTRIETMLGDVAVAVNPEDARYKDFVGKRLIHPFFPNRKMVVVADQHVDPTFGTGAVKITPAHDKNDYELAKRHNLPCICIFTLDGFISKEGGVFAGQHRFECRYNIQKALKDLGLLGDRVPNTHTMQLPRCSRSGDIVEYMLIPQWWCSCKDMAASAVQKVRDGELQIIPAVYKDVWFHWLENIKDWCISRQLWWGHRIPAYKVVKPEQKTETWVVGRNKEEAVSRACAKLGLADPADVELEQDEDVLDTWFSSGLFPLSVFGWPEDTPELKAYFPTTLLETGHDILFFWVARMVMLSLELKGQLPFSTVFLHAMVRDAHGQKMSKSKGNVIDPLEVIHGISLDDLQKKLHQGNLPEKEIKRAQEVLKKEFPHGIGECGCDALRMGLLAYTRQGRSVNLDLNRVVGYRHFCNKLWNATKFALDKFDHAESIIYGTSRDVQSSEVRSGSVGETRCTDAPAKKSSRKACFIPEGIGFDRGVRKDGLTRTVVYEDLQWIDRWILHRLATTCAEVEKAFAQYAFADVVSSVFSFFLYDFCDYYLEIVKMRLVLPPSCPARDRQISSVCALEVLHTCLDKSLRLLHPICPFITEELFQRLPGYVGKPESITLADYPQAPLLWLDCKLADNMTLFKLIVSRFRSLAAALDIPPKLKPAGYITVAASAAEASLFLAAREAELAVMASMSSVKVRTDEFVGERCVSDVVTGTTRIFLSVEEGVNLVQTCQKLRKKQTNLEKLVHSYIQKEAMPAYEEKVPQEIKEQNAVRKNELQMELRTLLHAISALESLCKEEAA